jgi:hypothetical protein
MNRREFLGLSTLAAVSPSLAAFGADLNAPAPAPASCFRVKPHAQLLENDSVAIVWMTHRPATGYVTWSQDGWATQKRAWLETDGLLAANACVHRAVIDGFDPRKRLDYKVHSRVFRYFGAYKVAYAAEEEVLSCALNAVVPADGAVSWAMINDVHENLAIYDAFLPHLNDVSSFCVFNGDILSHVDNEADVVRSLLDPLSRLSQEAGLPVWYLRGNHETRGAFARSMRQYLALKESRYYGAATIGGVRFVFIDTGEDKVDAHRAYSGLVDFDGYLAAECAWLRREVASPDWKTARARIVMRHIPPCYERAPGRVWSSGLPRLDELDAILKDAGVTLAMGAHMHRWQWCEPNARRPYPLIIGGGNRLEKPLSRGNATLVKCRLTGAGLSVRLLDQTGAVRVDKTIPCPSLPPA